MRRLLRAIARGLAWPARRFFDPRFQHVAEHIQLTHEATHSVLTNRVEQAGDQYRALERHAEGRHREATVAQQRIKREIAQLENLINADMDATSEAVTLLGRSIREIETTFAATADSLEATRRMAEEAWRGSRSYVEELADGSVEALDDAIGRLLNYATGHEGFAAQRNVWFNPPVFVSYTTGDARISHVNERIAEVPFVLRALASVPVGAPVLDVGASESTLCLSLATLGYDVTAIDPRPNPLTHPNLRVVEERIEDWDDAEPASFDATVCLSTIEHIGVGAYGQEDQTARPDFRAMDRMRELTRPGGLLILTTAYGQTHVDDLARTYDREGLGELLRGWKVQESSFLAREDETTWVPTDVDEEFAEENREVVVMVKATRED